MSDFNLNDLRESILAIELDPDPEGWIATATKPLRDGTAKEASLWTAFAMMATVSLILLKKIPWSQRTRRRFYILPLAATLASAAFYLLMAMGYFGKSTCKTYHLASSRDNNEPDDWQLGAVEGRTRLELCRAGAGLDRWEWRFILALWIGQFVTHARGSISSGSSAFGIITALDSYGPSDSDLWNLFVQVWFYSTVAFFITWSTYEMATHKDAQTRKFFFSLATYVSALYATQGLVFLWAKGRVFPSDLENIAYAIIDVLMTSGISLWLLNTNIPNVGAEKDRARENGDRINSGFSLSQAVLILHMTQFALWYNV